MQYYSSSGALLSNSSYVHCRSDSDSRLYKKESKWDISESGESTISEMDESESGTSSESAATIDPNIPYPGIAPVTLRYLSQTTRPRSWCLLLVSSSWFERVSMIVILLNCVTLGMYQPCSDKDPCVTSKCEILQRFDEFIFAFFSLEMTIKMIAMGVYGRGSYLADTWNRLDLFIVFAGAIEYGLPNFNNINFSPVRTIRVLRPLRAINRIPSMRILVMLLLDTLPMLGNVLLLCFFVFFIFGIVGVQLWQGVLRHRCVFNREQFPNVTFPNESVVSSFYKPADTDYICSIGSNSGMHFCLDLPPYQNGSRDCTLTYEEKNSPEYKDNDSYCINWNVYYTFCKDTYPNPFQETISFDNIGLAWIAIFLVISLEGWTEIMYYIQDGHSFWDWIYFVLLIVIGSFFMINLCLVVIATQFSETKKREMERMRLERARFQSTSTLASSTNNSEPTSCYAEIIKYIAHVWRRTKRRMLIKIRFYSLRRRRSQLIAKDTIRLNCPKQHHPNCSKLTLISSTKLLSSASVSNNTRRCSVMFSDLIILHGQNSSTSYKKNVCSSEKTTQAGDGNIWQIATGSDQPDIQTQQIQQQCNNLLNGETLTCQELLALGAINAALSTGQILLDIFFNSISKGIKKDSENNYLQNVSEDNFSCCQELWQSDVEYRTEKRTKLYIYTCLVVKRTVKGFRLIRKKIKKLVVHKLFQHGILLAILINTLSMGIEHHNQSEILTHIVEITNIIFSTIFAIEMLLKIIAEGPFGYISNGFNVFDGIIVVLSAVELFRNFTSDVHTDSGLSVLRTFRLLRILKLVRFMPNLRRQLFVMLRTMDNVAVFFSLLILFIFIFSILGMNIFGCKFCENYNNETTCISNSDEDKDRKNFDSLLWSLVTVFQILTQEDWNIVLSNGMAKTSHWAALYFVALMTFGNYVLFNLLVAILVEGFSSERHERREREQRELAKRKMSCIMEASLRRNCANSNYSLSSSSDNCFPEYKNYWKSAEVKSMKNLSRHTSSCDFKEIININYSHYRDPKSNIQKETLGKLPAKQTSPPIITHTAATPQDSPNMTLKDFSEFQFQSKSDYPTGESFQPSVLTQKIEDSKLLIPPKLSPPSTTFRQFKQHTVEDPNRLCKIVTYNEKNGLNTMTFSEKVTPAICISGSKHTSARNNCKSSKKPVSRYSFNPAKKAPEQSVEEIPLNNGRHHLKCSGRGQSPIPPHLRRKNCFKKSAVSTNQSNKNSNMDPKKNNANCIKLMNKSNESILHQLSIDRGIAKKIKNKISLYLESTSLLKNKEEYSLYLFAPNNKFRKYCDWMVKQAWFDNAILLFIALNCITLAMERPNIPPGSPEKIFLQWSNYVFSVVFATEMFIKVVANGMCYGTNAYFTSGWNIMDGSLVIISVIDIVMFMINDTTSRIFGILRVFRLLRSLRPLRVINRAPGLKLVVQTLLSSLRPIGNIVLICCTFFIIFGILGVQLFKGSFHYCLGENLTDVDTRQDCDDRGYKWVNQKYNFDDLVQALMSLFVLSSKDGWVNIMYTGLDAVGVDKQPKVNYSEWRLLYFITFILLVGFFVLNMFVGVVVENFHRCREEQEREEKIRKAAKRALQLEKRRRKMNELPYYIDYPTWRLEIHKIVTSKYFDLAIALVIGLNVITMATESYMMPQYWSYALRIFNYFFTAVFILESTMKLVALGLKMYIKDKWNLLDVAIVIISVVGILIEEIVQDLKLIPINPTIIRVLRVMRIARVLKLLKMAKGIRALLDTVMQALPQVGNLGLLFFLLFFIFAALGVELFGRLDCKAIQCQGLGEHAHFQNFGMAFLTLFRVATGDNWNGIMKDTLDDEKCSHDIDCITNCCVSPIIAPIFFVIFVLMAQFVLVNVVVAVLMKHLEESHKQLEDEHDLDAQIEREFVEKQERNARELYLALQVDQECQSEKKKLFKVQSLPFNFTYNPPGTRVTLKIENSSVENQNSTQSTTSNRITFENGEETGSDIYSIGYVSDEVTKERKYSNFATLQQNKEDIAETFLKEDNKVNKTKNEPSPSFLLVPQERELLQRSGSVKNLLRRQLSMDINEESSVLLTIPKVQKHSDRKILDKKVYKM